MITPTDMYPADADEGHKHLIDDLFSVLHPAIHYEFHDFKNERYAAPKIELYQRLTGLAENIKSGRYDNKPQ